MDIHFQAVEIVLEENRLTFDPKKVVKYNNKLLRLQKFKNVTNSILKHIEECQPCLKTEATRIRYCKQNI